MEEIDAKRFGEDAATVLMLQMLFTLASNEQQSGTVALVAWRADLEARIRRITAPPMVDPVAHDVERAALGRVREVFERITDSPD